jgi:hypothetical protein
MDRYVFRLYLHDKELGKVDTLKTDDRSGQNVGVAGKSGGLPVKVGLGFGAVGLLLTVVGIARGQVPLAPLNLAIALLIGGGVWFVVAWAVTAAAVDVEKDG